MAVKRYTYTVKTPLGKALILALMVGMFLLLISLPDKIIGNEGHHQNLTGKKDKTSLRWSYSLLDGVSEQHFTFDTEQTCLLSCTTESGTLTVELCTDSGEPLLSETFHESGEYTLTVIGGVTMTLTADHHAGSIRFHPAPSE